MTTEARNVASGSDNPKPSVVPADEPKETPRPSPHAPNDDKENTVPTPLAPELLPIGDPAGAA